MGFWKRIFALTESVETLQAPAAASFAVDADSIDPAVFGLTSYTAPTAPAPRVTRRTAIQVGAVKRSRDLVPGVLGTLPWAFIGPDRRTAIPTSLLGQPEKDLPASLTYTRLFEDLFFEQVAWWRITEWGWHGFPTTVERMAPGDVGITDGRVYFKGKQVPDREVIRFDSPTDGLLIAAARAIRTHLLLDAAHSNMVDGTPPLDYFSPADGVDPADDTRIVEILDAWQEARRTRSTGYVPAALKYNLGGWNPKDLQLGDAREKAVLEIARHAGVDPEELGVSTTSRTYANQFDRRKNLIDFTLRQFFVAVQDRLSMNDVCPRGYTAQIALADLLQSDPKTRYETYEIGLRVGAITPDQIAEAERNPTVNKPQTGGSTVPEQNPTAALRAVANFGDEAPELRLDAPNDATTFAVDVERRTVRGMIVPYGVPAASKGQLWQFSRGSLKYGDVSRVKLWIQHDQSQAVGVATELDDRPEGMFGTFKVARGAEGDKALSLAEDGVLDGFSIGLKQGGRYRRVGNVNHAIEAPLMETSLTPAPSFDDARVHQVAASAAPTKGSRMTPEERARLAALRAQGEATFTAEERTEFSDLVARETADPGGPPAPGFSLSPIVEAIQAGFAELANPQGGPVPVRAGHDLQVTEELPYRFDGIPGAHSFSEDIRGAYMSGDQEARQRLETFMDEQFAVTSGNVGSLNPTQNRPELYVPNLSFTRPLFELVSTGALTDKTPFTVPKFSSASGLVGNHTEGVEPTPGAFAATSQTVSPAPMSGKIEINREVWDQGGSPQADGIIWAEMLNGWFEAIEAKIAAALATTATAELQLTSAVDAALVAAMTGYFSGLQFVRGGNRFTAFAADAKLFPALVAAKDTAGRNLLPVIGPTNAEGTTSGGFDRVQVGNQTVRAAWALAQGANTRSYSFVPSSVWCWASAPKKFTFEYQVKSIDMAIWGYAGTAILRDSDVKPVDYDVSDA